MSAEDNSLTNDEKFIKKLIDLLNEFDVYVDMYDFDTVFSSDKFDYNITLNNIERQRKELETV